MREVRRVALRDLLSLKTPEAAILAQPSQDPECRTRVFELGDPLMRIDVGAGCRVQAPRACHLFALCRSRHGASRPVGGQRGGDRRDLLRWA
jgi:hypothetical protein